MNKADLEHSVLRRKAQAAREQQQARAMSPSKALRLSLARTGDSLFDLPLEVTGVSCERTTHDPMIAALEEGALLILLDGPEGRIGAISISFQVLAALIEVQTTGRVTAREAATRGATRTDAAMMAPFVNECLHRLEWNLDDLAKAEGLNGYRFGVMIENARMLGLALEAMDFHRFQIGVDIASGAKTGEIVLMVPVPPPETAAPGGNGVTGTAPAALMRDGAAMDAAVQLEAVLCRLHLPLSRLRALSVGDVLPLRRECLGSVMLETSPQNNLPEVRLGKSNGYRAVRVNGEPARSETRHQLADDRAATEMAAASEQDKPAKISRADPSAETENGDPGGGALAAPAFS